MRGLNSPQPLLTKLVKGPAGYTPTVATAAMQAFQKRRLGFQINCAFNIFGGYFPGYQNADNTYNTPAPAPSLFQMKNANVAAWAATLVGEFGCDYIGLTGFNEYSFSLHRSRVALPPRQANGYPLWPDYSPQAGLADQNIMEKMVTEFQIKRNVPVNIYINPDHAINLAPAWTRSNVSPYQEQVWDYYARMIQEYYTRFGIKEFWIDGGNLDSPRCQIFFDALHAVCPDGLIITNAYGDDTKAAPANIWSEEEYRLYSGDTNYRNRSVTVNGVTYAVGKEIIMTPFGQYSEWYYTSESISPIPVAKRRVFQDPTQFQGIINSAGQYNTPVQIDMQVMPSGELTPDMLTYLRQLNLRP